jgi:hypothetical protein
MVGYFQKLSDARSLGIRFVAVVPKQLIVGTSIGETASGAYAKLAGMTPELSRASDRPAKRGDPEGRARSFAE